jgi:hypothetical protein
MSATKMRDGVESRSGMSRSCTHKRVSPVYCGPIPGLKTARPPYFGVFERRVAVRRSL